MARNGMCCQDVRPDIMPLLTLAAWWQPQALAPLLLWSAAPLPLQGSWWQPQALAPLLLWSVAPLPLQGSWWQPQPLTMLLLRFLAPLPLQSSWWQPQRPCTAAPRLCSPSSGQKLAATPASASYVPAPTYQADESASGQPSSNHSQSAYLQRPRFYGSPVAGLCRSRPGVCQISVRLTKKQEVRDSHVAVLLNTVC